MIDVAILSIIRRWHLRDQISLREIARPLGISRNTVRRYLRADVTAPAYPARHCPGRTLYDWRHYLAVLQRKPRALRNGAPFGELPEGFRRLQSTLPKRVGGDREMVEILALVRLHDEQAVLTAVELALEAPSKQTILNILSRLLEGEPVPPITTPQALALQVEPQANVGRYERLRDREAHHAA